MNGSRRMGSGPVATGVLWSDTDEQIDESAAVEYECPSCGDSGDPFRDPRPDPRDERH